MLHLQLDRVDADSSNIDTLNVLLPNGLRLTQGDTIPICTNQLDILLYMALRERIPLMLSVTPESDLSLETVYIEEIDYLRRSLTVRSADSATVSEHYYVYKEGEASSDKQAVRVNHFDVEMYTTS